MRGCAKQKWSKNTIKLGLAQFYLVEKERETKRACLPALKKGGSNKQNGTSVATTHKLVCLTRVTQAT